MENLVTAERKDNTLFLFPHGRIDSNNAADAEEQINTLCGDTSENIIIDAADLEYISSAGLRVILRLLKSNKSLKIINANLELYNIFYMTGFTDIMTVEKAYHEVSIDGCEVIGRGSNGEVYRIDSDTIVKVYLNPDSLPDIQRERELAKKAFTLGIPTAISYDIVKVGNNFASMFELLNAKSFTKIIDEEPERTDEIIGMYVDLLKQIHSTEVSPDDMPDMKAVAIGWVNDIKDRFDDETWQKLYSLVSSVPERHTMIHGDYHTRNVMLQNGEALLIDMDTLCYGHPVFEFASIFNAYEGFYSAFEAPEGKSFIGLDYTKGLEIYEKTLHLYFGTDDEDKLNEIREKVSIVGFVRLLRRTLKRCNMDDVKYQNAVAFYENKIKELVFKYDTIEF